MKYFYDDDCDDLSDLKSQSAWERKMGKSFCPECEQTGTHATGCPENKTADEKDEETDGK